MENINFIKNIDNLGRIVIPMDIRRKLQINTGDVLSITCNDNNIQLTKYNCLNNNLKINQIIDCFIEMYGIKVILCNKEYVTYSNLVSIGSKIDGKLRLLIKNGSSVNNTKTDFIFGEKKVNGVYNIIPIIGNEGIVGSLIVFGGSLGKEFNICSLISKIIMLELNIS